MKKLIVIFVLWTVGILTGALVTNLGDMGISGAMLFFVSFLVGVVSMGIGYVLAGAGGLLDDLD